ncbi:hypothetical protein ACWNT8_06735 [Pigmentibacter ruber]
MYKKSVKLTAIGLGLVSFALVSCKSKNDNKNNESANPNAASENKQNPRSINNLKIAFNGKIPLGGCTSYTITSVDDKGNVTDVTNHAEHSSSNVSIALTTESKNKFFLNQKLNQICAVKENEDNNVFALTAKSDTDKPRKIAAKAGDKAIVSVINHNYSQHATVEVAEKGEINAFNFGKTKKADLKINELHSLPQICDSNGNCKDISLNAHKGEFSDEFVIAFANSNQLTSEKAEYLSDVKILKAFIDNKEVKIESRIDDKEKVTFFKVAIPAKLSENAELKLVLNKELRKTIKLEQKRKVKAVSLLDGNINGNVLYSSNKLDVLPANLFIASTHVQFEYFDGEKINVTANYDAKRKLQLGSLNQGTFTEKDVNGFSLSDTTSDVLAFNNLLKINLEGVNTEFSPKKVALKLNDGSIGEFKFYVGNKPTVDDNSPEFKYKGVGDKLVSAQQVLDIDNKTGCAHLTTFKYNLGNTPKTISQSDLTNNLVIESLDNSLEVVDNKIVCATKEATPRKALGQESVHYVIIRSKEDPTIQTKFGFKIGESKLINHAALVDDSSNQIVEEIRLNSSESRKYKFAIYNTKLELSNESIKDFNIAELKNALSDNLKEKVSFEKDSITGVITIKAAKDVFKDPKTESIIGHIALPNTIKGKTIVKPKYDTNTNDVGKADDYRSNISIILSK